jgi:hypothetical protein
MRPTRKTLLATGTTLAAVAVVLGVGLTTTPVAHALPLSVAGAAATTAIPAQTVQATVQPNASQAVLVPVPTNADRTTIPLVTSDTPNLMVQSASYTGDQQHLIVSLINADPRDPSSGHITVAGWGTYPATVQPNPSQLVAVALPANYDTSKLPYVVSQDPNLILISLSYGYNADGTQYLAVNVGNPFPDEAVTGDIQVDW